MALMTGRSLLTLLRLARKADEEADAEREEADVDEPARDLPAADAPMVGGGGIL